MKYLAMKKNDHKKHGVLYSLLAFFIGVTLGFLISPIKKGIGNNSGNTTHNYYGNEESTDDLN